MLGWRTLLYCFRGTHDHCDVHGRVVPCHNVVGALGVVAVARLCLTLPRTTPRLRVLILISPLKFLWQQHAGQLSIGQDCVPRSSCSRGGTLLSFYPISIEIGIMPSWSVSGLIYYTIDTCAANLTGFVSNLFLRFDRSHGFDRKGSIRSSIDSRAERLLTL